MSTSSALPPPVDPHLTFLILLQWLSLERVWVGLGRRQAGSCVHTLPSFILPHSIPLYILWLSILHIFCFSPFLLLFLPPLLSSFLIPSPSSTTLLSFPSSSPLLPLLLSFLPFLLSFLPFLLSFLPFLLSFLPSFLFPSSRPSLLLIHLCCSFHLHSCLSLAQIAFVVAGII